MRRGPDTELPQRAPDLRLVPPALATWGVVLLGVVAGPLVPIGLAAAAALITLSCWRRGGSSVLTAASGCAAAAGLVITTHMLLLGAHPLRAPAERGAAATARVVLSDDPHPIRTAGYGSSAAGATQVLVAAELRQVQVDDGNWATGGRMLLIAPAAGWSELLPGQVATAEGLLAPAGRRDLTVAVLRVRGPPAVVTPPPWWQVAAGELRAGLRDAAAGVLPPESAGLLPGLTVGDTSGLTAEVEADFRAAGLTHLLAVSGANLAIVSGAVLALLRLIRADPRLAALLSILAMVGFVVLARPSPSVVRAAVMGGIALVALSTGRGRSAVPALATAVLVLVLADPALAVDPGFALSVLATGGLVLLAPPWAEALCRRGLPRWAAEGLVVPTAAFVVTIPLVAGLSGQLNPVTVPANLLAAPAVAPATVLGVLAAVVSPFGQPAAELVAWAAGPAVGWLVLVGDRSAAVAGAALPWPTGPAGGLLLGGVVVVVLLAVRSPRWRVLLAAVVLGTAVVLVPTRLVPPGWPPAGWSVVACDVGQGDAIVLATGQPGWVVLVDAGPDDGLIDNCLDRLGVRGVALVVLSHLHADHIGGLAGALRGRPVGGVAIGPVLEPRWALRQVADRARAAGAPLVTLAAGRRLGWPALTLDVIGPPHAPTWVDPEDGTAVNDGSVVLRAATRAGAVLLTGDVELAAQAALIDAGAPLHADLLKLPHHGSRYTSPRFLAAVAPRAVLVSVGAGNRYRHPDTGLLERLGAAGVTVARTDRDGDVAVLPGPGGHGDLTLVRRGAALPGPRRAGRSRRCRTGVGSALGSRGEPGCRRGVSSRGGPAPRAPPRCWRAPLQSGRSARPPRPASSTRPR
ncbi:MAG TPA: ComEC/Rec2 family competence protein [Pseudonocardia sp.]|nr:ComEC/Rec2 family competence protein [Pseudonocardia sp.]